MDNMHKNNLKCGLETNYFSLSVFVFKFLQMAGRQPIES